MNAASLPAPVCREWFGGSSGFSIEPISGGFSGARVYRCEGPRETVALRQWPAGTGGDRLEEIHRVMQTAYARGCRCIPRLVPTRNGGSFLSVGSRFWDCSTWRVGRAWEKDRSALSPTEAVQAGCQAIAAFHNSVADLKRFPNVARSRPSPAVHARWRRLLEVEKWLAEPLQYQTVSKACPSATSGALPPACLSHMERQVKAIWHRHGSVLRDRLNTFLQQSFPLQYVLRDVHRDHVLFNEREVSGLIDFDAVRVDTPAADLARFVGSFYDTAEVAAIPVEREIPAAQGRRRPSLPALWDAAMAGYRAERPFPEQEFQLAKFLAEISPFLSLVNWAVWSTIEPRQFESPPERIAARAEHLSLCLHATFGIC